MKKYTLLPQYNNLPNFFDCFIQYMTEENIIDKTDNYVTYEFQIKDTFLTVKDYINDRKREVTENKCS